MRKHIQKILMIAYAIFWLVSLFKEWKAPPIKIYLIEPDKNRLLFGVLMYYLTDSSMQESYIIQSNRAGKLVQSWYAQYRFTGPRCKSCGGLIFPGEPIGQNGEGLLHLSTPCCPTGGFYVGHLDKEGNLVYAYPDKKNLAIQALKHGKIYIANFSQPSVKEHGYLMVNFAPSVIPPPQAGGLFC